MLLHSEKRVCVLASVDDAHLYNKAKGKKSSSARLRLLTTFGNALFHEGGGNEFEMMR